MSRIDPATLKAQSDAGHKMKELGLSMMMARFEGSSLNGKAKASYDGMQKLRSLTIEVGALDEAGGDSTVLAKGVLDAMQEAFDQSFAGSEGQVWNLYRQNPALMQAPLGQIGEGATAENPWANVTRDETSERLALEIFQRFDADNDGFWNMQETAEVQRNTEGSEITEESFNALVIAAAPNGGRNVTEDDLAKGLSREQVITLYTDAKYQKQLGFVLNVHKDHAKIFSAPAPAASNPVD